MSARSGETERRWATVLFADLTDSTGLVERSDDEAAYEVIADSLRLLGEIARRHGAGLVSERGDGVMAVFGAPRALEQAARAGVNAAIEMRSALQELPAGRMLARPLSLHAGVNTGTILSGDVQVGASAQRAVVGDAANVAARLASHAGANRVLVGPETWRATRDDFEFRALEPVALKGRSETLACWELLSTSVLRYRSRPGFRSGLVGRDDEMALLRDSVRHLAEGRGGSILLSAEAGLGKSRLLAELAATEESAVVAWLEARSIAPGQHRRHHLFIDMLLRAAGLEAAEEISRVHFDAAVLPLLGDESAELTPFLAAFLHAPLETEEQRRLDVTQEPAREARTRRAVVRVLTGLSVQQPLVIVFDDLHWADDASIELLASMIQCEDLARHLLVCSFRPGYPNTSARIAATSRSKLPAPLEIELSPLVSGETSRLVANLIGGAALPDRTRSAILAGSGGNPFFVEAVTRSLVDDGALEERDGRLVPTERIDRVQVPGTVQEVVAARVERLDDASRRLLEVAAAIGPSFPASLLARVAGKDDFEDGIAPLIEDGLFAPMRIADPGAICRFSHPIVQQVVYEQLLGTTRRRLHARIAAGIESLLTERAPGYHAMLAYHFELAGDAERAERLLFQAGEEAARAAASSEALHFFRRAAELYRERHGAGGDPAARARLDKHVAMAHFNRGELADAVIHFTHALAHLGAPEPPPGASAWLRFGVDLAAVTAALHLGSWRRPRREATATQREILDLRFRRCLSQTTTSPAFVFDTIATLRLLARVDPRSIPEAGGIYAGAVGVFSYGGVSFALGRRILDLAREVAAEGDLRELGLYYRLMAFLHHHLEGDWSAVHEIDRETLAEGERFGRIWEVQTYLDFALERRTLRGEWNAAIDLLDMLGRVADAHQHRLASGARRYRAACIEIERGELDAAVEGLLEYCQEFSDASLRLVGLGTLAKVHVLRGDLTAASSTIRDAERVRDHAGLVSPFHLSRLVAAHLLHDVARIEAASRARDGSRLRALKRASRRHALTGLWIASRVAPSAPELFRAIGSRSWLLGHRARAERLWQRSLSAARSLGMEPELGRTVEELTRRRAERDVS